MPKSVEARLAEARRALQTRDPEQVIICWDDCATCEPETRRICEASRERTIVVEWGDDDQDAGNTTG